MTRLQALKKFLESKANQKLFDQLIRPTKAYLNQIRFERLDIQVADMVFQSIPDNTEDSIHLVFIKKMLEKFSKSLLVGRQPYSGHDEKVDYHLFNRFSRKYARFLLHRRPDSIAGWLQPFINPFIPSENMASFISDIVSEQNQLEQYESFWSIWLTLYAPIRDCIKNDTSFHRDPLIHNYFLAWQWWNDTAKEWHTLKPADSSFFKKACEDLGHHPEILYSIRKILEPSRSNLPE